MESHRDVDEMETETSNLVLAAEVNNTPESFKRAALKEIDAATILEKYGNRRFVPHLFSAGWCAYHAKDKKLATTIVSRIEEIADLNSFFAKEKKSLRLSIKKL